MLLAFLLTFAACTAFSLAMDRHLRQVWPGRSHSRHSIVIYRCCGILFLMTATYICAQRQGLATGLVSICGLATLSVTLLALLFSYRPRWLAHMDYLCARYLIKPAV
jgi:hypothetical protein